MSTEGNVPDVNSIVAHVITNTAEATIKHAGGLFRSGLRSLTELFQDTYTEYLAVTYQRVSTIKTFINPQQPIDLLANFVSLNLRSNGDEITEADLISSLRGGRKIVISALAGRGKSVLMKYVALSKYHAPTGSIPLFIELRQINNISSKNLLAYIHNTYKGTSKLGYERFIEFLSSGSFILILDGFDEISPEFRNEIENQILEISNIYSNCSILVSGRPDEKFNSWAQFTHYSLCPMTLNQVEKLIGNLEYDKNTKNKFLAKVKSTLFQTHESFLSTPLLATLMLLTFDQYADIPDKLHIFYDNAFETLFRKHDAMKDQYVRSIKSNITVDVFRKIFAAFCALSYAESKVDFSRNDVIETISKSISYFKSPCKEDDFLFDLVESVCLLHLEGFEYHFVHRSFQEYFCALFLANSNKETRAKFLSESWMRPRDSVLTMLFDMSPELVEEEWTQPEIARCIEEIELRGGRKIDELLCQYTAIGIIPIGKNTDWHWYISQGDLSQTISILRRLYPAHFIKTGNKKASNIAADMNNRLKAVARKRAPAGDRRFSQLITIGSAKKDTEKNKPIQDDIFITFQEDDEDWLTEIGLIDISSGTIQALKSIQKDINEREKLRMNFLKGLFPD